MPTRKGLAPHLTPIHKEDVVVVKCDICDEEFESENKLLQHKAQMHAGEQKMSENPEDADLEEPDYKQASGQ